MFKNEVITRLQADEIYKKYHRCDESQLFFDALIDGGINYVELVWNCGKIFVKAIIENDLVTYEFDSYDDY